MDRGIYQLRLEKMRKLLRIWGSAAIVSFLMVMTIYTMFFGRNRVTLNATIYENYRLVGQTGTYQLNTAEGYGITTYGENGLIANKQLDPTAFKVLFVGDSYVKAKHVSDHEKFTEIIERDWNASHPDQPIQTLNLGLGGQDMRTYLSFVDNMDAQFCPDLVFLMTRPGDFDHVAQNPKMLARVANGLTEPIVKPEKSTVVHDLLNQLGLRSFFGQLQAQTCGFLSKSSGPDDVNASETGDKPPVTDEAIAIQLKRLKDVFGDRLVMIYRVPVHDLGRDAPSTYEDNILRQIREHEIPVINLYQPFLQAFQARRPPTGFNNTVLGRGHCNQYGHHLIAAEVLKFMETIDIEAKP